LLSEREATLSPATLCSRGLLAGGWVATCCIHSPHNAAPTEPYNPLRPSSSSSSSFSSTFKPVGNRLFPLFPSFFSRALKEDQSVGGVVRGRCCAWAALCVHGVVRARRCRERKTSIKRRGLFWGFFRRRARAPCPAESGHVFNVYV